MTFFKLDTTYQGPHANVRVFVGPDEEHLALAGSLTFDRDQYKAFTQALHQGVHFEPGPGYVKLDADLRVMERQA